MSTSFSDASTKQTFQLKGTMLAITVFELAHFNIERLTKELSEKVKEAPEFFGTIPMVLSIDKLEIPLTKVELKGIITLFKEFNIQLMALRTNDPKIVTAAKKWGLSILPPTGAREKLIELAVNRPVSEEKTEATETEDNQNKTDTTKIEQDKIIASSSTDASNEKTLPTEQLTIEEIASNPAETASMDTALEEIKDTPEDTSAQVTTCPPKEIAKPKHETKPTMLISAPVRSGQQINALDCDLIVTSAISTGAELMSDGNIHIYGTMRGRAMAGFRGNNKARIFCTKLTAELLSIAGQMITEEELRHNPLWGKPAQLYLEENQLIIVPLT